MKNKKSLIALSLSAVLAFPLLANAQAAESAPKPLVMVDDFAINNIHLAVFAAQNSDGKQPSADMQLKLFNELINTFMIANSKEGKALAEHPELRAAIEVQNARLLAQALINDRLENVKVSEQKLQEAYDEQYKNSPSNEYKARHILLETEDAAKAVIAELDKGADFAETAKAKSTGPSSTVGGDLGWFAPDQMVKPFSMAVASMQDGKHSQSPVKTQFGWHVILREASKNIPVPSFDDVREELAKKLRRSELQTFIRNLRANTKVEEVVEKEAQ